MTVQDDLFSRKKAWKAFQADYDYVFSLSDRVCSYCLTDQQVAAMLVMTEYLKWPTRWVKSSGNIDPAIILNFSSGLESNLMSGCCDDNIPIQYRYSTAGVLQRSVNGGSVWEDAPQYDPRNYSPEFPPVPGDDGDDKKCSAATGAAQLIKEQVADQLTDDMSRYTLGQLINDWVKTFLESSNPFTALVTVTSNQIFALVISVLRPALTDDVFDILKCILYCRMADDASFNDATWAIVRSDILSKISGVAGIFLEHLVYLIGVGGLTNIVRSGFADSGDCSTCCPDVTVYLYDGSGTNILQTPISGNKYHLESILVGSIQAVYVVFTPTGFDTSVCALDILEENFTGTIVDYGWYECTTGTNHLGNPSLPACVAQRYFESSFAFAMDITFEPC